MKLKKVLAIMMSVCMVVGVTACGGSKDAGTTNEATKQETAATSEESKDVIKIQVGYENATTEPAAIAVEKWAELVKEKSNGTMELELFPNSALGKKTELIDQMILGEPIITVADGAFLADYGVADFGIFYAPFMFDSWDEEWAVIGSDWYKDLCSQLADKAKIRVLSSNWIYGARNIMTTKKIVTPEDIAGVKLRVSSNKLSISSFESLGASAVGMDMGDVYQALQAGTIDGVENPITSLANRSFQEVAKYVVKDEHILATSMWICGDGFYSTLTDEQKTILSETADEAGIYNNDLQADAEAIATQLLTDAGVEITELTPEQKAAWVEAGKKFYDSATEVLGWSAGLYDTVKAAGAQ
ncbi:MAG: TRAP-type transport system periplasmic protein [Clostridiales bacterium]|nr:TRAP-type transport system periplasmic protein [Clostridiales bacterium]